MASAVINNISSSHPWLSPSRSPSPDDDFLDFEFLPLHHPNPILPADQLFSDGKLLPLLRPKPPNLPDAHHPTTTRLISDLPALSTPDDIFSPRVPTCSAQWLHLLRLRRKSKPPQNPNPTPPPPESQPARLSLSSPRPNTADKLAADLPRFSLDDHHLPRLRLSRPVPTTPPPPKSTRTPLRRSIEEHPSPPFDSPRMSSSGKIVFQGLERSSSHPGSVKPPGPKPRPRGMDRSYSANVRVTPVLNVPVCSLRGSAGKSVFGQLFSSSGSGPGSKKDVSGSSSGVTRAAAVKVVRSDRS